MADQRTPRQILRDVIDGTTPRTRTNAAGEALDRERDYTAEEQQRTKEQLQLRLRPEVKQKALRDADAEGLTVSAYVTNLVTKRKAVAVPEGDARRPGASNALLYHMAGNSTLIALEALSRRAAAGDGQPFDAAAIDELKAIRREIVRGALAARPEYDPDEPSFG